MLQNVTTLKSMRDPMTLLKHQCYYIVIPLVLFQCLKESYVKATGTGIGHDLQSVEFNISTNELSPQVGELISALLSYSCGSSLR